MPFETPEVNRKKDIVNCLVKVRLNLEPTTPSLFLDPLVSDDSSRRGLLKL